MWKNVTSLLFVVKPRPKRTSKSRNLMKAKNKQTLKKYKRKKFEEIVQKDFSADILQFC